MNIYIYMYVCVYIYIYRHKREKLNLATYRVGNPIVIRPIVLKVEQDWKRTRTSNRKRKWKEKRTKKKEREGGGRRAKNWAMWRNRKMMACSDGRLSNKYFFEGNNWLRFHRNLQRPQWVTESNRVQENQRRRPLKRILPRIPRRIITLFWWRSRWRLVIWSIGLPCRSIK